MAAPERGDEREGDTDAQRVHEHPAFSLRRRRRTLWVTAGAVAVTALVLFVAVALFSPIMSVRQIVVTGLERLDEATVQDALADLHGRPLALVTGDDVAQRISGFVLVQSYSTRAEPPSTLVIDIVERQAIGAGITAAGYTVFDAAGIELWEVPNAPSDVPVLDLGGADTTSPAFAAAAEVSLALPTAFRATVATITARSHDSVTLSLRDGTSVVWGSADDSHRKVEVLLALITATADDPPSQYDVSSPETPVTR